MPYLVARFVTVKYIHSLLSYVHVVIMVGLSIPLALLELSAVNMGVISTTQVPFTKPQVQENVVSWPQPCLRFCLEQGQVLVDFM